MRVGRAGCARGGYVALERAPSARPARRHCFRSGMGSGAGGACPAAGRSLRPRCAADAPIAIRCRHAGAPLMHLTAPARAPVAQGGCRISAALSRACRRAGAAASQGCRVAVPGTAPCRRHSGASPPQGAARPRAALNFLNPVMSPSGPAYWIRTHIIAATNPEMPCTLQNRFLIEAAKRNVLPLDPRSENLTLAPAKGWPQCCHFEPLTDDEAEEGGIAPDRQFDADRAEHSQCHAQREQQVNVDRQSIGH